MAASRLAKAIQTTATSLGVDPTDLATAMSYETGGTFDEWKAGPTTQYGQHRGLIQWGEPQRKQYGVYKGMPVEDQVAAAGRYLQDAGVRPGMGMLDIYSAINAGHVGRYNAADANNGGAAGTVRDKVNNQMAGHRQKAQALLGGAISPMPSTPYDGQEVNPVPRPDQYANTPAPLQVPTISERIAAEDKSNIQYGSFSEEVGAGFMSNAYAPWMLKRLSEGAIDPTYQGPSEKDWTDITATLPENYHDGLLSSGSQETFNSRLKSYQEDYERVQKLDAGGWSGTAASFLGGALDPVAASAGIATGGLGTGLVAGAGLATRVGVGALSAGVSNAAMEAAAGHLLADPNTDPKMALIVGAGFGALGGVLSRNLHTRTEAEALLGETTKAVSVARGADPQVHYGNSSAGAAVNTNLSGDLIDNAWGIRNESVPTAVGGKLRFDVTGQMTTDANPLVRMVGSAFAEETVGFKDYSVVQDSAAGRATAIQSRLYGNLQATVDPALRNYLVDVKASFLRPIEKARKIEEFHQLVNEHMETPDGIADTTAHPAVQQAAKAYQGYYQQYAGLLKDAGLMEDAGDIGKYTPKMTNSVKVSELAVRIGDDGMETLFRNAMLRMTPEMDVALAHKMAKGYWRNIQRAGYGIMDPTDMAIRTGDREGFKQAFGDFLDSKSGLTSKQADEVFNMLTAMVDSTAPKETGHAAGVARLKRRTLMDYTTKLELVDKDGKKVVVGVNDLFSQDSMMTARRYGRQVSGRVAFAKTVLRNPDTGEVLMDGIKSSADLEKLKEQVRNSFHQEGKTLDAVKPRIDNTIENIDFLWKRINGTPVYGQDKQYAKWVNRLKSVEFIRLMSNMGLNQVQESWKIASTLGFRAAMKQLPAIRRMVDEAGRSVPRHDELLKELEHITGQGLDGMFDHYDFRVEEDRLGTFSTGIGQKVDNVLDLGKKLTADVSLMHFIHGYQQRWVGKAVVQHLYDIAKKSKTGDGTFDTSSLAGKEAQRLSSFGLDNERASELFNTLLTHATEENGVVKGLGSDKWSPEVLSKFQYTLRRYTDRLVQANDFGGLSKWMSNPVAALFTQFRSFVFGAWAKSTLYAVHHFDPRMLVLISGELAAGTATYAVKEAPKAVVTGDWSNLEDPKKLLANGFGRMATSSILPMVADSALLFTPVQPMFGNARSSGSPTDAFLGSAAMGHLKELAGSSQAVIDKVMKDREFTQSELNTMKRALVPLGNNMALSALWAKLIEDAPQ